jgi:hypothetical protein
MRPFTIRRRDMLSDSNMKECFKLKVIRISIEIGRLAPFRLYSAATDVYVGKDDMSIQTNRIIGSIDLEGFINKCLEFDVSRQLIGCRCFMDAILTRVTY